ncbi:bifunctional RNase H/acid phosphatase [Rhodobacteraceae bacterium THAF1]|uniref:histidine phosphatase family protein n=1 Tax=Palleronia sp. THAF1 TaxID=2587842 RepID=UPI000F3E62D8|nr:histidine phosphatase family protein [Palleronia sp. THAF1]QFU09861.1 bifunctional RNase H/acid phosphatase [Palleronia sp. THAF1]VDC17236.1 bifunctional RNase H/acid phosphatase [Rhodobacteraceae bacterium THAF1]
MGEIVLVRHGQANSEATSEEDYDRLSDLGFQQAGWLGEWLTRFETPFDAILSGTLRRHRETAQAMGVDAKADARLNEMDYFNLGRALADRHGIPMPDSDGFAEHAPKVMRAWHAAEIMGNESFADFEGRIVDVLTEAAAPGRRVLCVTSGGVIGIALRHVLGLDTDRLAYAMLPIHNASIHRFHIRPEAMVMSQYNATPHLDAYPNARTHY